MGIGESQKNIDMENAEEGCSTPLRNRDLETSAHNHKQGCSTPLRNRDPETCADNPKQGIWQKLKSSEVPLLYVVIGAPIFLIIIVGASHAITALTGKDPACLAISTGAECKDDWVLYRGKFYYISNLTDTWNNSQDFCKSHNSSLAIINDEREMNFLNLLNSNNYWIGLSRTQDDSGWVWTNGTFYSETIFNITRKPATSNESEHVYLNGEGFNSHSGRYSMKYICSKSVRSSS